MNRGLKLAGLGAGGLFALILLAVGGIYGFSSMRFGSTYEIEPSPLETTLSLTEAEWIEKGAHLATIRGCVDCHGGDFGGTEFFNEPPMGVLWATNLTSGAGGAAATYSDADWDRSIRHGVGPDGKPLMFMPSHEYWPMSDDDIAALIAYFRSLPPVDRAAPEPKVGPLGRALFLAGQLPLVPARLVDHGAERPAAPAAGPTAEYGAYLATGCTGCHGAGFSGGAIPGTPPDWPPAANLTPDEATGLGAWTEADFVRAMREGVRPDGSEIDPVMPVEALKHMTDDELSALWAYLQTVEPKELGNR